MKEVRYIHVSFKTKEEKPLISRKKKNTRSYRIDTIEKKLLVPADWDSMNEKSQMEYALLKVKEEANKMNVEFHKLSYVEDGSAREGVLVGEDIYTYEGKPIK